MVGTTIAFSADLDDPERLTIDGGLNGCVQVNGWSRDVVEVRAKVWATARSVERAQRLARDVRVVANGGHLSAEDGFTDVVRQLST